MENLIKNLEFFETEKVSFSIFEMNKLLKETNNENISRILIEMINKKMNLSLNSKDKFTIYCLIKRDKEILKIEKNQFNGLLEKIFSNPTMKYLKNYIDKLSNSSNIKFKDYIIDLYIFTNKTKKELNHFNKLYQLLWNKIDKISKDFNDNYLSSNILARVGNFLIDSTDFFNKKIAWFFAFSSIYFLFYYKYQLELLGFSDDIIDITYIFSILKLFLSVYSISIIFVLIIILYIYFLENTRIELHRIYKITEGFLIYLFSIIFLFYTHNFWNSNKENIDINDTFLNQYIHEKFYPRFIEKDNSLKLVLGFRERKLYFYPQENLIFNNVESCKLINEKKDFEKTIISILKNSKKIGSKFLDKMADDGTFKILNKEETFSKLSNFCNN